MNELMLIYLLPLAFPEHAGKSLVELAALVAADRAALDGVAGAVDPSNAAALVAERAEWDEIAKDDRQPPRRRKLARDHIKKIDKG